MPHCSGRQRTARLRPRRWAAALACASLLAAAGGAAAQRPTALAAATVAGATAPPPTVVTLAGSMGTEKALLVINGQPRMLGVGGSAQGVTLRRLAPGQADVEVGGRSTTLLLGGAPARLAGDAGAVPAGNEIVLPMGPGGHFAGAGSINGRPVQFLVDTGATTVALSQAEANRIGLDWKHGRPGVSQTANGPVPVYAVNLTSVRLGGVELTNVAAVVLPAELPMVLLGNSFLGRFSMRQDSDVLRLAKKP